MDIQDGRFKGSAVGREAVSILGHVYKDKDKEKTKRLLIGAACLFFLVAAIVVVFAPSDKQNLSYALGAGLVVMALGAIGVSQFAIKLPSASVETNAGIGQKANN